MRLFTKQSNSREAEVSTLPQEALEKKEEDPPTEVKDKEQQASEQQQIAMVKQKDKKGSRFFDLFRKGKKSKTKHLDEKPEEKEQEYELPD